MPRRSLAALAVALPLFAGCHREAPVGPLVVIAGPEAFHSFELRDGYEEVLWRIVADEATPVSELVYGVVPEGFRQELPPAGAPRALELGEPLALESLTPLRRFRHEGWADTHQRLSVDSWAAVLHDPPDPSELDAGLVPP